jgi:hypothetical protein
MSSNKERFAFHLDNALKHKLQVLADSEDMKLGGFINEKLKEIVEEFESRILDVYGSNEFLENYHEIFGAEYPPLLAYDVELEFDRDEMRKKLVASINRGSIAFKNGAPRNVGARKPMGMGKREPSDE